MYVRDTHSSMNEKRFIGIVRKCLMIDNNRFTIKKRGEKKDTGTHEPNVRFVKQTQTNNLLTTSWKK